MSKPKIGTRAYKLIQLKGKQFDIVTLCTIGVLLELALTHPDTTDEEKDIVKDLLENG